jgi:hypothetical protein
MEVPRETVLNPLDDQLSVADDRASRKGEMVEEKGICRIS